MPTAGTAEAGNDLPLRGKRWHPLLGDPLASAHPAWSGGIDTRNLPYLSDHRVQEEIVFPAAAYIEMALACAKEVCGDSPVVIEDLHLERKISLSHGKETTVQFFRDPNRGFFEIYTRDGEAVRHATGKVRPLPVGDDPPRTCLEGLGQRCQTPFSPSIFYQQLSQRGLHYGSRFQGVQRIWVGEREALAEIQPSIGPEAEKYRIHPAILDACFQLLLGATLMGGVATQDIPVRTLFLPVRFDRIRFYGRPGNALYSSARLTRGDSKHVSGDLQLLDNEGKVFADIEGFHCQGIEQTDNIDNYLYEQRWTPKERLCKRTGKWAGNYLASPSQIAGRIEPEANRLIKRFGTERYLPAFEKIQILANTYILEAFQNLGCTLSLDRRVVAETMIEQFAVAPHHKRLLERIFSLWEQDGLLRRVASDWEVVRTPQTADARQLWKSLWERHPGLEAELLLLRECGERLAEIFRGDVDPQELLLSQGSGDILEHLYRDSPTYRISNLLAQRAVEAALAPVPESRTVRVLEVGGGTGSITSYVLRKLPPSRTDYIFTDPKPAAAAQAKQRFSEFPFVQCRHLDIAHDPKAQGFEPHSFDLILASGDLSRSLDNIKGLLASKGLLILLDGTNAPRWEFLVFGLLPDSVPQEAWQYLLRQSGFTEITCLAETADRSYAMRSVILAQGPEIPDHAESDNETPAAADKPGTWMIFADRGGIGAKVAAGLQERGQASILISPAEAYRQVATDRYEVRPDSADDLLRTFQDLNGGAKPIRGVVHLWGLDTAGPLNLPALEAAQTVGCLSALRLVQVLVREENPATPRLWLVTNRAHAVSSSDENITIAQAPLWGLARVVRNEHPTLRCASVDLSTGSSEEISSFVEELLADEKEDEIALRGRSRYVHRLRRFREEEIRGTKTGGGANSPFAIEIATPRVLRSFRAIAMAPQKPGPGQIQIEVYAAGLNFKDVMIAMGMLPDDALEGGYTGRALGMECSGKVIAMGEGVEGFEVGDEVVAVSAGSLGTHVTVDAGYAARIPKSMTFEEAATIPIAFLTVYYSLHQLSKLRVGERVLIHAGAGGVGLAAIQIAHNAGAEVVATAGSPMKRDLLRELGVRHVLDSRSLAFADAVMEITGGRGVDVVLNSLAGEAMHKSISVLAPYGRFLEIGKTDIYGNSSLELRPFRKNLSYHAVDLDRLLAERPELSGMLLRELMERFAEGSLHPLPHRVFSIAAVSDAFRHMRWAKHIGKVVVSLDDEDMTVVSPSAGARFRADTTYLITGGLGGFGLATARWLVKHGARHLVLMGRSGAASTEATAVIGELRMAGAEIVVAKADVTREEDVRSVLQSIHESMPPLRGVIHGAMVLDDGPLTELNDERMWKAMRPKMVGAWNLHTQTLGMPLDFFVLFSSLNSLIGLRLQGNYVAGNAFLDALAGYRRAQGLPGLTANWGAVADVGFVAQNLEVRKKLERVGFLSLSADLLLDTLGKVLEGSRSQVGVTCSDWKRMFKFNLVTFCPRYTEVASGGA